MLCPCSSLAPPSSPGTVGGWGCPRSGVRGTGRVSSPPQSVGSVYSGLMQGVGAAEKVFEFIDRQPTMVHDGNLAPDHVEGRVDFENVTFTYRTRPHTKVLQVRRGPGEWHRPAPIILSRTPSLTPPPHQASGPRQCGQEYARQSPCAPAVWALVRED